MDRKYRREPSCVLCELQFCFKDPTNPFGARCPLLLHCGHSVCEGCLKSKSRGNTFITCSVCSTVSQVKQVKELRESFPLNLYAVGQVSVKSNGKLKSIDPGIGFFRTKKKMASSTNVQCCECGVSSADCSCRQCNAQLCTPCFNKIHSVGVILSKHEKILLAEAGETFSFDEAMCKDHPGNFYEFFCDKCCEYCCKDCVFQKHLQHSCKNVKDMNDGIFLDFQEAYTEANNVLKQLYATQKKVCDAEGRGQDKEVLRIERQVSRHFSYLHGLLQTQEEALQQQLRDSQTQRHTALEEHAATLETSVKEMESILMHSKAFLNVDNLSSMPLCFLLDKLKNITAMPCHLVNIHKDETSKLELKVDESVIEQLKSHCTLSVPERRVYELRSKFDLPDDYVTDDIGLLDAPEISDPIPSKLIAVTTQPSQMSSSSSPSQLPNTEAKTKKNLPEVNKNREIMQKQNKSDIYYSRYHDNLLESICNMAPLFKGTTEIVKVCHFVTPNNFYVQRKIAFTFIEELRDHFSKQANLKKDPPNNVELGQMYLVLFPADKKWYRGVLKRIDEEKNCEIFYLDYGNKEKVHISKLRDIPEKYIKIPGQAIHCSLYSCAPIGNEWSEEVFSYMATMSQNVDLSMYVERINQTSGLHEVHLRNVEDFNGSFTDAMVFLGCASRTDSTIREEGLYKSLTKKTSFKNVLINKGETFDAHVTHINSPTNFYIQKVTDGGKLMIHLNKELKAAYSLLGPNQALVYSPTVGMPVAVKYKDGDWYRGQVLNIPRPRFVEVLYVDYGNVETVQWTDIRTLQSKFLRTGAQGLKCALSDVAPTHSKGWQTSEKDAFDLMIKKRKILRAYVDEVQTTGLKILLYDITKSDDVCFNGLLVKKGFAKSVGRSSAHAVYPREIQNQSESDSLSTTSSVSKTHGLIQAKSMSTAMKFVKPLPLAKEDQCESLLTTSMANSETSLSQTVTESELKDDSVRVKIMVLKVVTPGEIYVTFESLQKNINKLTKQMTQYYGEGVTDDDEEDVIEDREWREGDLCAVLKSDDKHWYRGVIKDVGSENYKVFIKDIVEQVSVDKAGLRSLAPQFTAVLDGSVKCHLGGLKPPGRSHSWPAGAFDVIITSVNQHENHLYMTKLGDLVNDSMPIQLLAKKEKIQSALDPIKEEWEDFGQKVINLGFANRDHECGYCYTHTNEDDEDYHHDFESQKNLVLTWLNNSYEGDEHNKPGTTIISRQNRFKFFDNVTQWRPPEPFKDLDFIAVPTYVDFECAIYLQDYHNSLEKLDLIERALLALFDGSTPKPHDLLWSKGQICCAYYELNGKWYRAMVLNVTEEHIEVIFVDYGNTEFVQPEQLRKQISMAQIPIQCHRCLTEGLLPISPDNKWPIRTLDFIHGTIVTKECRVRLKPPTETSKEYVILNLNVPGGEELMDVLLSMHYATYVIDCDTLGKAKSEVDGQKEEDDTLLPVDSKQTAPEETTYDWFDVTQLSQAVKKLTLKEFVLPDSVVELNVQVVMICTSTTLKVNIEDCEDVEVISILDKFKDLHEKMQIEAEGMPVVLDPYKGMVCVGCFSEDNSWYRAIIKEVYRDENLVTVHYVDYGNDEKLPIDRLREMKKEWSEIPKQAIQVTLHRVREGRNYDVPSVQNMLTGCCTEPLTMVIEARHPSLQVVLYNVKGELAYQPLLDVNLLAIYD